MRRVHHVRLPRRPRRRPTPQAAAVGLGVVLPGEEEEEEDIIILQKKLLEPKSFSKQNCQDMSRLCRFKRIS